MKHKFEIKTNKNVLPLLGISDLSSETGKHIGSRIPGIKITFLASLIKAMSLLAP